MTKIEVLGIIIGQTIFFPETCFELLFCEITSSRKMCRCFVSLACPMTITGAGIGITPLHASISVSTDTY